MNKTCDSIQWLLSAVSQTERPCSCWHPAGTGSTAAHGAAFWLSSISVPCSQGHLFVLDLLPLAPDFCWKHQYSQTIPTGDWGAQLFSCSVWDCCESHLNSSVLLLKLIVKQLPPSAALVDLLFLIFPGFPALETVPLPWAHLCWSNLAVWWCWVALLQLCWEHMSHFRLHRLIESKNQAHFSFRNGCLLEWNSKKKCYCFFSPLLLLYVAILFQICLDLVVPCLLMVVDVVWHIYLGGWNVLGSHESDIY